jgi:hypothetical protein
VLTSFVPSLRSIHFFFTSHTTHLISPASLVGSSGLILPPCSASCSASSSLGAGLRGEHVKHFFPLSTLFCRTRRSVEFTSTRLLDPALTLRFRSFCLLHFGYIFKFIIMHPESYAARKGLSGIGHVHCRHFKHTIIHESYEISMASDMPDRDTFNLSLEFLDLEGKSIASQIILP